MMDLTISELFNVIMNDEHLDDDSLSVCKDLNGKERTLQMSDQCREGISVFNIENAMQRKFVSLLINIKPGTNNSLLSFRSLP